MPVSTQRKIYHCNHFANVIVLRMWGFKWNFLNLWSHLLVTVFTGYFHLFLVLISTQNSICSTVQIERDALCLLSNESLCAHLTQNEESVVYPEPPKVTSPHWLLFSMIALCRFLANGFCHKCSIFVDKNLLMVRNVLPLVRNREGYVPPVNETKTSISSLLFSDAAQEGGAGRADRSSYCSRSGVRWQTSDNT